LWVTPAKMRELVELKKYKNINWYVRLHSKVPFLAIEGIAMKWIVEYHDIEETFNNFFIAANSPEISHDFHRIFGIQKMYMPNIYYPETYKITEKGHKENHLNVGCFGAIRPLKNQLIQAIAAIEYGEKTGHCIHFHINSDRQEQTGENVFKNLTALFKGCRESGHRLINHEWLTHSDFIKLIVSMDIGLQVSLSETFNIVTADFIWNDIPIIGSPDIDWLPDTLTANPNSSRDILLKMEQVLTDDDPEIHKIGKIALKHYNTKSKKIWRNLFE
jgi:hypothetical protein